MINNIQFVEFGLPIFPPLASRNSVPNMSRSLKTQTSRDKSEQDTSKVNNDIKTGPLPVFLQSEVRDADKIIVPSVNRNYFVNESIRSGNITPSLQQYTREYGIYNPNSLGVVSIAKPKVNTDSNRTDILFNKTIGKLFDPTILPKKNIFPLL